MSAPIDNGGPAFPTEIGTNIDGGFQCGNERWHCPGLSIRDYFAAKAMQADLTGHIGHYGHESHWPVDQMASHAYEVADAMLKARQS